MDVDERLGTAVQAGDVDAVRAALAAGSDPNSLVARFRTTALATAAEQGHLIMMVELLRAGADANLPSFWNGVTPLRSAIVAGQAEAVRLLIDSGADPSARSGSHMSALLAAISATEYSPSPGALATLKLLLDRGAVQHPEEEHPLIAAVEGDRPPEIIRMLVRAGSDPDVRRSDGAPAIVLAARRRNAGAIDALICAGSNVNAVDDDGRTALMHATERDDLRSVGILMAAGADANRTARDGSTALDLARAWNRQNAIHRLGEPVADGTHAPYRRTTMEAVPTGVQLRGDAALFDRCQVILGHVLDQLGESEFTLIAGHHGADPRQVLRRLTEAASEQGGTHDLVRLDLSMPEWQVVKGALLTARGGPKMPTPPGLTKIEIGDLRDDLYRRV